MRERELHIFDFDGTLFKSPTPPPSYNSKGWWDDPRSLEPPCVPEKPGGAWYNSRVVSDFRRSSSTPGVVTVVMTGRKSYFRPRVKELLNAGGMKPDELILKQSGGGATEAYKIAAMRYFLKQMPTCRMIEFWEDRHHHLKNFKKAAERMGYNFVAHPIKPDERPAACDIEPLETRVARGWKARQRTALWNNLSRLASLDTGEFGILSAHVVGYGEANKARHQQLISDLQKMGYTQMVDLQGSWKGVPERSLLIPNMRLTDLVALGRRYNQDAIVHKPKDGDIQMYHWDSFERGS